MTLRIFCLLGATLLLAGCTTAPVDHDAAFAEVRDTIGDRTRQDLVWRREPGQDGEIASRIAAIMASDLTLGAATQVALLNNRALQARYADLGIARADLVQAGVLSNPVLDVMARPTTHPVQGAVLEFGLAQSLLDIFFRPARLRTARGEFAAVRDAVATSVLETVTATRKAYIAAVGAANAHAVAQEIAAATDASAQLANQFHQAGNISALALAEEQALHEEALGLVDDAALTAASTLNALAALLNVAPGDLRLPQVLAALPTDDMIPANAERQALERRLDIAAHRSAVAARLERLKYKTGARLWREIGLAVAAERDTDGQWAVGPGLSLALPLFDRGGPAVARAAAELLKAENELADVTTNAHAQIATALADVAVKRRMAERYRSTILPLRANIVRLKQAEHNYMLIGIFDVLLAKREETRAYLDYVNTVRDYWIARAELAQALGGTDLDPTAAAGERP